MVKRIVFLRNPEEAPAWGGLEKLMMDWFKRIDYASCQVILAVSSDWVETFKEKCENDNLPVKVLPLPYGHQQGSVLNRFLKLVFFLRKLKPSTIIFVQGWFFSFNFAEILAGFGACPGNVFMHENLGSPLPSPKESKKYFGFINGVGLWWYFQIFSANFRSYISKKIIVVSQGIKRSLVTLWYYPDKKILVKYHGIDLNLFRPCEATRQRMRDSLKIPGDTKVLIAASRLTKIKCVHRTIEAFDALLKNSPDMVLFILGQGEQEEKLKALAQSLPSAKKIFFLGHVDAVADFYKMADIYVLSSDNEGFGLALIEAMACGLSCIATKCTGPNEILQDGINGYLVEKNSEAIREALSKILRQTSFELSSMKNKAIQFVQENAEINERVRDALLTFEIPYLKS